MATAFIQMPLGQRSGPATGDAIAKWGSRLEEESKKERRAILLCFGVGVFLNGIVTGACFITAHLLQPPISPWVAGAIAAAVICAFMFLIAAITKPEGRAETARTIFDAGMDGDIHDRPEVGTAFSLASAIALYGSYALVEAAKRTLMRIRLLRVDRRETARVLAEIYDAPVGVHWKKLLRPGQTIDALRGPIALLLMDGWIQIVDGGQTVALRSPAMRRAMRRHPLADVFVPET